MLDRERKMIMPEEKQVLTADQYVVKLLGDREKELTKLQDKYDELLKRHVKLQVQLEQVATFKARFTCDLTISKTGYSINYHIDNTTTTSLMYSWELDPNNQPKEFQELLDILGLELPKGE